MNRRTEGERPESTHQKGMDHHGCHQPSAGRRAVHLSHQRPRRGRAQHAVFAPDAVVVDDGATYATEAELRGLIQNQIVAPKVVLTPISYYEADRLVASGDGDFPGNPLTFAFFGRRTTSSPACRSNSSSHDRTRPGLVARRRRWDQDGAGEPRGRARPEPFMATMDALIDASSIRELRKVLHQHGVDATSRPPWTPSPDAGFANGSRSSATLCWPTCRTSTTPWPRSCAPPSPTPPSPAGCCGRSQKRSPAEALESGREAAFDDAMDLLALITTRLTGEFAIRAMLNARLERTLEIAHKWAAKRTCTSGGSQARGRAPPPLGQGVPELVKRPGRTRPIVDALYTDEHEYVRRSVASHVNDLSRDDPDLAADIVAGWLSRPDQNTPRVARHALRTTIKTGHPKALELMGFNGAHFDVDGPAIAEHKVPRWAQTSTSPRTSRTPGRRPHGPRSTSGCTSARPAARSAEGLQDRHADDRAGRDGDDQQVLLVPAAEHPHLPPRRARDRAPDQRTPLRPKHLPTHKPRGVTMTRPTTQERILSIVQSIPAGRVTTYGAIADQVEGASTRRRPGAQSGRTRRALVASSPQPDDLHPASKTSRAALRVTRAHPADHARERHLLHRPRQGLLARHLNTTKRRCRWAGRHRRAISRESPARRR